MPTSHLPPIGERIRAERGRRGLTVRGLAGDAGVSASLISQIETAKAQPSVSTLYAIATALGIGVEDLLSEGGDGHPQAGRDDRADVGGVRRRVGPVVRPGDLEPIELESGVTWELLGQVPGVHTEFLRVTYPPGASSSSSDRLMRHPGTEYGYLVSGELVLTLGFEEHVLRPGDAISFESRTPHCYRNRSDEPAVGIWFVREDEP
ncbi:helix-turn-helix domain-containing protein [Nocardioides gansuensis]|uniref:helix-turn-helix domain-containing protein n=1 Tax=Nocardioides gansuensis TaxID=2138300 RepID=UPI001BABABB5|nr:cupin domain-containing protein [Nocardioides gansuensis]